MRSTELEGIPAVVRSSIFLGNTTHYFLELGDGSEVEAIQDSDVWEIIPQRNCGQTGSEREENQRIFPGMAVLRWWFGRNCYEICRRKTL